MNKIKSLNKKQIITEQKRIVASLTCLSVSVKKISDGGAIKEKM